MRDSAPAWIPLRKPVPGPVAGAQTPTLAAGAILTTTASAAASTAAASLAAAPAASSALKSAVVPCKHAYYLLAR